MEALSYIVGVKFTLASDYEVFLPARWQCLATALSMQETSNYWPSLFLPQAW
jgi:hypothetical protein